jgi:hypothetical protein
MLPKEINTVDNSIKESKKIIKNKIFFYRQANDNLSFGIFVNK